MVRNELMTNVNPVYGYLEKFHSQAVAFFMSYTLEKELGCPDKKISDLLPPKNRICRFCGLKMPNVTFRMDAHIYSEFLGNRYLVSDFECDDCNAKFGSYEDNFFKFLGVAGTMLSVKGKEKIPKFKSPGEKLVVESTLSEENQILIQARRSSTTDTTFDFDKEKRQTRINFTKPSYVPLKAYKALLKMALSLVNEKELSAYEMAFEFLKDNTHDKTWLGMAHVYQYAMPYTFCLQKPCGFLYRKRNPTSALYTHVFVLNALNSIFELAVPFHFADLRFANKKEGLILPWAPPLFGGPYPFDVDTIQQNQVDFSLSETLKGEMQSIAFSTPQDAYDIERRVDKDTGEIRERPFDGSKIKGIDFLREPYNSKDHPDT